MQLFFGVGSGRVASMSLANALNTENRALCLHEGKVRDLEEAGEQVLPFLTLQNRRAYEFPEEAEGLFQQARGGMMEIGTARDLSHFGDIAYNYSPFIICIAKSFPSAKVIFQIRDCLGFLISSTSLNAVDETPVGWPPADKPQSKVERFVALGRLQPRKGTEEAELWSSWSYLAKNIWLWAETNRLILDAVDRLPALQVYRMRFERFQADALAEYQAVRDFIGLEGQLPPDAIRRLTERPINLRSFANRTLTLDRLDEVELGVWRIYAEPVRARLGY